MGIVSRQLKVEPQQEQFRANDKFTSDPRPDLQEDHHLWNLILERTNKKNPEISKVLHGLRCGGTRIKKEKSYLVLRPDIDSTGDLAWESLAEYEYLRDKYLILHLNDLIPIMKQISKEMIR